MIRERLSREDPNGPGFLRPGAPRGEKNPFCFLLDLPRVRSQNCHPLLGWRWNGLGLGLGLGLRLGIGLRLRLKDPGTNFQLTAHKTST